LGGDAHFEQNFSKAGLQLYIIVRSVFNRKTSPEISSSLLSMTQQTCLTLMCQRICHVFSLLLTKISSAFKCRAERLENFAKKSHGWNVLQKKIEKLLIKFSLPLN